MAEAGINDEAGDECGKPKEIFAFDFGKAHEMHELRETKDEDTGDFVVGPDEDSVGEEREEECDDELVIFLIFLVGVDDTKEDTSVFKE